MFALSAFTGNVLEGIVYTLLAGLVVAIVRAAIQTARKRQVAARDDASLREYFFDTEANPRTGVPAKEGWTSKVDKTLAFLAAGQARTEAGQLRTERVVKEVLAELQHDGNGQDNFRGMVERGIAASADEAIASSGERDRGQRNEDSP